MGLFSKQECAHCGNPANLVTRTKLADGKYICFDCSNKCPLMVRDKFLSSYTYQDYLDYIAHREENRKRLESFRAEASYFGYIHADLEKGWMIFTWEDNLKTKDRLLNENPDIFEMKDLIYSEFFYNIKDIKEGVFHGKVKADVRLVISFKNRFYPYSFNEKVLANYRHRAEITGIFSKKVSFTDNDKKSDLEYYLLSTLEENGIQVPGVLGGKLTSNFDFSPYSTYFSKLFELRKLGVYSDDELDIILGETIPSAILRHKVKSQFKR